jgi:putative nucleotidyltransferase with HDIG domain
MGFISSTEAISMISESSKYEHSILVSRIMSSLAEYHQIDKEEWVLAGLLHDLDYDKIEGDRSRHGLVAASLLEGMVSEKVLYAIRSHDHRTGIEPITQLDKSLKFADSFAVLLENQSVRTVPDIDELSRLIESESRVKPWIGDIIESYCDEYGLSLHSILDFFLG